MGTSTFDAKILVKKKKLVFVGDYSTLYADLSRWKRVDSQYLTHHVLHGAAGVVVQHLGEHEVGAPRQVTRAHDLIVAPQLPDILLVHLHVAQTAAVPTARVHAASVRRLQPWNGRSQSQTSDSWLDAAKETRDHFLFETRFPVSFGKDPSSVMHQCQVFCHSGGGKTVTICSEIASCEFLHFGHKEYTEMNGQCKLARRTIPNSLQHILSFPALGKKKKKTLKFLDVVGSLADAPENHEPSLLICSFWSIWFQVNDDHNLLSISLSLLCWWCFSVKVVFRENQKCAWWNPVLAQTILVFLFTIRTTGQK